MVKKKKKRKKIKRFEFSTFDFPKFTYFEVKINNERKNITYVNAFMNIAKTKIS
jgi:hypothetical protein